MKSFITLLFISVTIFSCEKKMTPTASATTVNEVKQPVVIHEEAVIKTESPAIAAGKTIYTTKCARCHGPKPVDNWTVQQWVPILDRMVPKARLDDAEKANVTAYVNFYAKNG